MDERLQALDSILSGDEVWWNLFDMSPFKALDPNGFHVFFFQRSWDVVGDSVIQFARNIFNGFAYIESVNSTLIILIPKQMQPETLHNLQRKDFYLSDKEKSLILTTSFISQHLYSNQL